MRIPASVSLAMLLVMTLVGAAYLTFGVLDMDPRRQTYVVRVEVATSGGLMKTSQANLRGMPIGRVRGIDTTATGLAIRVELDARYQVPAHSEVRIANLSAAGEQYLDFRPADNVGPYLRDGSVIPERQVWVSESVGEALGKMNGIVAQLDPVRLASIQNTLEQGWTGRDDEVRNMWRALELMANTLRDKGAALGRLYDNTQILGDNFEGRGGQLGGLETALNSADPAVIHLLHSIAAISPEAYDIWDEPLGPLVQHVDHYFTELLPDFALLATVLKPATAQVRPLRVDAGSIVDLLSAAFPEGGAARVSVVPPR
ncbi:MlaD family protein [Nocardia sp. NPDC051832]|uniref:MlaD family protein n=1 Tax=Nocardia sp. NPDC051832 TaxID=3155673 RepID=UPI00344467A1